jgi:hypothetical protein
MTKAKNEIGVYGSIAFIGLTQGYVAMIDVTDVELIAPYRWYAEDKPTSRTVYAAAHDPATKRRVYMHRVILGLTDPKIQGEHGNGCGIDNRRNNIRVATQSQNMHNRGKLRNNKTGYLGVDLDRGKYRATICAKGKRHTLARCDTPQEAAFLRDLVARILHDSQFVTLNFTTNNIEIPETLAA